MSDDGNLKVVVRNDSLKWLTISWYLESNLARIILSFYYIDVIESKLNFASGGEPLAIYIFLCLWYVYIRFFLLPMHLYCVLNKDYPYRIYSMQYKLYPLKTLHLFFPFDRKVLCAMYIMLRLLVCVYIDDMRLW